LFVFNSKQNANRVSLLVGEAGAKAVILFQSLTRAHPKEIHFKHGGEIQDYSGYWQTDSGPKTLDCGFLILVAGFW